MPVDMIRTIASVGCSIDGSGTVSTRTSRLPCQVTAFIPSLSLWTALTLALRPLVDAAGEHASGRQLGQQLVSLAFLAERFVQQPCGVLHAKLVRERARSAVRRDLIVLDALRRGD